MPLLYNNNDTSNVTMCMQNHNCYSEVRELKVRHISTSLKKPMYSEKNFTLSSIDMPLNMIPYINLNIDNLTNTFLILQISLHGELGYRVLS